MTSMHIGDLPSPDRRHHEFGVLCIEASGERLKEAENLVGHLLFAVVTMVFIRPFTVERTSVGKPWSQKQRHTSVGWMALRGSSADAP